MVWFDGLQQHAGGGKEPDEPRTTALVVQAQRGDSSALERLVERYLASLTAFCYRLAGAQGGAQDLVQETLLRAVVSLGRLEAPDRFEAWLFGIAANLARKRWQRERRVPLSLDTVMAHPDVEGVAVRPLWATPEIALELAERARELERAIGALPRPLGRVLALHYAEGLSYAQIAAQLGVPVSTVKGRLFQSRRRLRLALGIAADRLAAGASPGGRSPRTQKKGMTMPEAPQSHDAERLIASADERIATSAAFYQQWFGRPMGVSGLAESSKDVLRRATAESERYWHSYLGTEHLLLGLLGDEASVPGRVLGECGVRLESARAMVQYRIGRGQAPVEETISLVPRVKTVIEMAADEARRLGAPAVGAEHLLLGLLREGDGIGALVIMSLGADLDDVRDRTRAALQAPQGEHAT